MQTTMDRQADTVTEMLIISFSELVHDARVVRQISHFSKSHEVTTVGFGTRPAGVARHISVPVTRSRLRRKTRAYVEAVLLRARAYRLMYWTDPMVRAAQKALKGRSFDRILANDINTVPLACTIADPKHVHADLHEYYPGLHDDLPDWVRLRQPYLTWLVREWGPRTASVSTVSAGLARAYRELGVEAEVVTNAPPLRAMMPSEVQSPIRLVHAGAALRGRRIEEMIQAVSDSTSNITLTVFLTPNNPEYVTELSALASLHPDRVNVLPPVKHDELLGILNGFDVGIHVLPPTVTNQALALPNKLFDFVQARLGVVVGPTPEMASIVTDHGLGTVTDGFGVDDIRRVLNLLDADKVMQWKEAAHRAARDLSSESQLPKWDAAIERLPGSRQRS